MKHLPFTLTVLLLATPAFAGMEGMNHAKHGNHTPRMDMKMDKEKCHCTPATKKFKAASAKMHKHMAIAYTGDFDTDFVRGMIPHHQGAIDMAQVVLDFGYDPEIRELATRIIAAQKQEIATMKHWLETRGKTTFVKGSDSEKAYTESMHAMHAGMDIKYTGKADVDFAHGMIPHHQGAIDMAWVLKEHGRDPMLQAMADDVIRSQSQEIALMKEWLSTHQSPIPKPKSPHHGHTSH